jgi:hypothetical protein
MLGFFVRRALDAFSARYDYDVGYMRAIHAASPRGFMRFARVSALAMHREAAPKAAWYAAKLVGALAEDCGPCTQLVVNMAREAGVDPAQIEAVLRRDANAMSADTALGFRFAEAVALKLPGAEEAREAVRAQWGEKGLIDLAFALQIGRMFPMVKDALGFAKECRRVEVGGRPIDVVRRAA